jgi:hypothetical protein
MPSAGADQSFVLAFAGTDTAAAVNMPDPCDASGRQRIYSARVGKASQAIRRA